MIKVSRNSRKWGWGYSVTPTGNGTEIETPIEPNYTGTIKQVVQQMQEDRTLQSYDGGTFMTRRWFWDGKPVKFDSIDGQPEMDYINGVPIKTQTIRFI